MPRVRINDFQMFYEFHGPADGELVILNNGVFMNTASWAFQLPELARRYRVLTYDMRGQGQSDHPEGPYSFELHADDLVALMDALDLEKAHMVGTSYGGELNLMMGIAYPERCRTLTIIASVSHGDPICRAIIDRWIIGARMGDGARFFRLTYPDVYGETFLARHPEIIPMAEERYGALDLPAAVRLLESFQRFDVTADLGRIKVPTCIASAENDVLKPRKYGEIMHAGISGSEFHLVPDSGHVVIVEKAAEVNSIILGFLAKHSA